MEKFKGDKAKRILGIYTKLMQGCLVKKAEEAEKYCVEERTIQRDIDAIRAFFEENRVDDGTINFVEYDRISKGYRLCQTHKLTNSEILAVCKILLESRAFTKQEMSDILDKLISCCVPEENKKFVMDLISNEVFHYVEPRHKREFLDILWDIGQAIHSRQYIEMEYRRTKDQCVVKRKVKPVAIMFSEYYFYLTAFIDDEEVRQNFDVINDSFPTIYRIDRIKKLQVLKEKFHIPYSSRFEEGELRKRIQFMYGGKLQKVKFEYYGNDIDAILDRLPTATILSENEGVYTIGAEVFGTGIDMWFRSQGDFVKRIE